MQHMQITKKSMQMIGLVGLVCNVGFNTACAVNFFRGAEAEQPPAQVIDLDLNCGGGDAQKGILLLNPELNTGLLGTFSPDRSADLGFSAFGVGNVQLKDATGAVTTVLAQATTITFAIFDQNDGENELASFTATQDTAQDAAQDAAGAFVGTVNFVGDDACPIELRFSKLAGLASPDEGAAAVTYNQTHVQAIGTAICRDRTDTSDNPETFTLASKLFINKDVTSGFLTLQGLADNPANVSGEDVLGESREQAFFIESGFNAEAGLDFAAVLAENEPANIGRKVATVSVGHFEQNGVQEQHRFAGSLGLAVHNVGNTSSVPDADFLCALDLQQVVRE